MYIFLDESGDLGFDWSKLNTSKYFVVTVLVCDSSSVVQFRKAVRRTLKNINFKKNKKRIVHELKGSETSFNIKKYFHKQLNLDGWGIYSVVLNKKRVYERLQSKIVKKKLYNFIARYVLERIDFSSAPANVNLVMDKCKNNDEIKDFNEYVENQLCALLPLVTKLYITHEFSHENTGLQAVDMFCWGMARKLLGDTEWYNVFKENIRLEEVYLRSQNKKDGPFNI